MEQKFSPAELQVMEEFWKHARLSVREIQESFPEKDRPPYTSIQTIVYRLEEQGAVRRVEEDRECAHFRSRNVASGGEGVDYRRSTAAFRRKGAERDGAPGGIRQADAGGHPGNGKADHRAGAERAEGRTSDERPFQSSVAVNAVCWRGRIGGAGPASKFATNQILALACRVGEVLDSVFACSSGPDLESSFRQIHLHSTQPRYRKISNYFAPVGTPLRGTLTQTAFPWSIVIGGIWLLGVLFLTIRWFRRWRGIRNVAKRGTRLTIRFPVPVLSARSEIEPGVFGIFRPVLLVPEGLADHLTQEQLDAVLAHESRHVVCRDNLTGAAHMCVETLFWFHPLVWWIGARLMDEREKDCDEAVLRRGSQPRDYAEGIVSVCRTYVESPLACAPGISGSDLKKRIRGIMMWLPSTPMTIRGKVILTVAAMAVLSIPFAIGIVRAQTLPPAPEYGYEVASIHRSAPETPAKHLAWVRRADCGPMVRVSWCSCYGPMIFRTTDLQTRPAGCRRSGTTSY